MLDFDSCRDLKKRHKVQHELRLRTMSENGTAEDNRADKFSGNAEEEVPEIHTLTQEAVNEQIQGFIAPSHFNLEEFIRLVQRIVVTPYRNHYPRIDYSTISCASVYQPDAWSWSCFITWSSWFMLRSWYDYHIFHDSYHDHGIIIMFSFFFGKNALFVIVSSNSGSHIPLYGTLGWF